MYVWNDCIKKSDFYTEFREKMQFSVQNPNFHSIRSQILMIQSRQSCWNWLKNRRKNSRIKQNIMLSEQKAFNFVRVTSISTLEKDVNYQVLQFLPRTSIWTKLFQFLWRGRSATSSKYFPFFSMGDRLRLPPSAHAREISKVFFISKSLAKIVDINRKSNE